MTHKRSSFIKLTGEGFLLGEAIFSLFVAMIVAVMLQGVLKTVSSANKSVHHTNDLVFAYVQFNRFLHDEETEAVYTLPASSNFHEAVFVKVKKDGNKISKKTYFLTFYKDMIRTTTSMGGHMPLLLNVAKANFLTKNEQIKVEVTEKDGRKSTLYFKFDSKPMAKVGRKDKKNDLKKTKTAKRKYLIE